MADYKPTDHKPTGVPYSETLIKSDATINMAALYQLSKGLNLRVIRAGDRKELVIGRTEHIFYQ